MGYMSKKLSFIITGVVSVIFLIFVIVSMINLLGGLNSNGGNFSKNFKNGDTFSVSGFKKKFGFKTTLIALDFKFGKEDIINIKADELSISKGLLSSGYSSVDLVNGEVTIYLEKKQNLIDAFNGALNTISSSSSTKIINLENTSFVFISKEENTKFIIDSFTGNISLGVKQTMKGTFAIGGEKYELESFNVNNDFEVKLSSSNISFKTNLTESKGKIMLSINSLSKFLNDITPDTINIDLKSFDGAKNTIYFETDISYNDVKKSVDFANSKIQAFGGKAEEVKIEPLNNNLYRISLELADLTITPNKNLKSIQINEGKLPVLQFGALFPESKFELVTSIGSINIADGEMGVVKNFKSTILFEDEIVKGNINFLLQNKFEISAKGLIQNYESSFRKGMIAIDIKSSNYENKNIIFNDFISIKNLEPSDLEASLNLIIAGETGILEAPLIKYGDNKIINSKLEFNIYSIQNNYALILNAENINLNNIRIKPHSILTSANQDLFKVMFDYLKFKNFNFINFTCIACKADDEILNIGFKQSVSSGKIEIENFTIDSANIKGYLNGIIDVRNPEKNILNLFVNISQANEINLKKASSISNLIEGFQNFKLPSLDSFSGTIGIKFNNITNGFTKMQDGSILLGLNYGSLKILNSSVKLNNVINTDWISMQSRLSGNNPDFVGSVNLSGVNIEDTLSYLFNKDKFDIVKGYASIGVGFSTKGFLLQNLINNLNANIEVKSNAVDVKDLNIDAIALVLLNENISFKRITNANIAERRFSNSTSTLSSTMKFANNEITIEAMELKGVNSTSVFVGKMILKEKPFLQMLGKTATVGANLNNNLKGVMPIYLTSSITSKEDEDGFDVKIDFSQVSKYAEARRVLYK